MEEQELQDEIKKAELKIIYLSNFIKCDDCGKMYHLEDMGEIVAWSSLCKNCIQ